MAYASGTCGDNVTWELSDDGVLTLSGSGATYDYGYEYDSAYPPWYDEYDGSTNILSIVVESGITRLGEKLFYVTTNARSVSLPDTLRTIGSYAFGGFGTWTVRDEGLELHVVIPEGVTAIEDYAFSLSFLTSVSLPTTLQTIGDNAFDNAWFTSITIPASVTSIGKSALGPYLTNIEVMSGNTSYCTVDGVLFNISKTELVNYPKAKEGTSYTVPDGVKKILDSAFYGAEHLTSIILPDTLIYIGGGAFGALALTSIDIPDTVTYIGSYAFSSASLNEVKIPENIYSIKDGTFKNTKLTKITIPEGVTSIGYEAFYGTGITTVIIPKNVSSIGDKAFPVENMVSYSVDEANQYYSSVNGVLFNEAKTELLIYPACKTGEEYTVPDGVAKIGINTFDYVSYLKKIILPASVEKLYCLSYGHIEILELKGKSPPTLPSNYHSESLTTIIVPYGTGDKYKAAEGWKDHADIIIEAKGFPLRQFILGLLSELTAGSAKEPIAYLYNGVRLPKLPEWDREVYPYAYLCRIWTEGYAVAHLFVTPDPMVVTDDGYLSSAGKRIACKEYKCEIAEATEWADGNVNAFYIQLTYMPFWANTDMEKYLHDSGETSSIEDDVYTATGEIVLEESDPVPVYE